MMCQESLCVHAGEYVKAFNLTGVLGFEPRDGETKTRCLTTWRRPIASKAFEL
jgi:hypothetical protein